MNLIDSQIVLNFFGLLVAAGLAGRVFAQTQPRLRRAVNDASLDLILIVAAGATAGSLYLSNVVGLVPCELCWFQRIAMYPIAALLVLARARNDRNVLPYVFALSVIGIAISSYHIQLQLFPEQASFCEVANPCTGTAGKAFGWMTIPQMAAGCFALIGATALSSMQQRRKDS